MIGMMGFWYDRTPTHSQGVAVANDHHPHHFNHSKSCPSWFPPTRDAETDTAPIIPTDSSMKIMAIMVPKKGYAHSELTGAIISCAMEVHKVLGPGFQEVIYQRALDYEMMRVKIDFGREVDMPIFYKDRELGTRRVDFLVADVVTVEIKAVSKLEDVHLAQAKNYIEAFNLEIGLLLNFGSQRLQFHRLINNRYNPNQRPRRHRR